jgi:signal transduction histidine kinase
VEIAVADEGIGIPAEHLERVFDRFHRVDASNTRKVHGTGLGLHIVRQLVELHGGAIRVESTPGQGSTFRVSLPAAAPGPAASAEASRPADAVPVHA